MTNRVLIKKSGTANAIPTAGDLLPGELAINYTDGNLFYKNSSNVVTLIASNRSVSVTGNVTGNYFIGNGSQLTGIVASGGAAITNGNSNVSVSADANVTVGVTGTPNIAVFAPTGFSVIGTIGANGTITGGSIDAGSGTVSTSGNITGGNLNAAGLSLSGNALIGGDLIINGNISYLNVDSFDVEDPIIGLGRNANNTPLIINDGKDRGTDLWYYTDAEKQAFVGYKNNTGKMFAATDVSITSEIVTVNSYGTFVVGGLEGASVSVTGNVTGGNLIIAAAVSAASVSASGNVTGNYILGNGALLTGVITSVSNINNGTSNVSIATANANVTVSVDGTSNVAVFAATGEYITGIVSVSGNIIGANINGNGSGLSSITGANVTGQVPNALVSGTVYTADQSNITSVGILTSLSSSGNVTGGNLITAGAVSAASVSASGNVNSGNLISAALVQGVTVSASGNVIGGNVNTNTLTGTGVTIGSSGNINLSASGNIVLSTQTYINNLSSPIQNNDAATKQYVDDIAQGLHTHDSCNAATTGTLATISSGTVTYDNGTAGVGATLTTTGTYTTIDGVTLSNGMRILVKNEANTAHNGIYDRTNTTVLTRSTDFDTPAEMAGGDFTFVTAGTLYDNTGWVMTDVVTTVGTSPVTWVQFSGAGTYTAGTGLTLTGTVFSVNASQTQVTTVGTLGSLAVTANITGGNILTGGIVSATGLTINNATTAITNGATTGTGNIGSSTVTFNTVFAKATSAQYADVAEQYLADADYPPGTVLIFGGEQEVTANIISHSTAVAGVVSENPSYLMNSGLQGQHVVSVALLGRVFCQVEGTIRKGDLLVASDTVGVAQRLNPVQYQPGCIIGKSLENYNSHEIGIIEIAVGVK